MQRVWKRQLQELRLMSLVVGCWERRLGAVPRTSNTQAWAGPRGLCQDPAPREAPNFSSGYLREKLMSSVRQALVLMVLTLALPHSRWVACEPVSLAVKRAGRS